MKRLVAVVAVLAAALVLLLTGTFSGGPSLHNGHQPGFGNVPKGLTLPRASSAPQARWYDAVTLGNIPHDPFGVGCYASGSYVNCGSARTYFSRAHIITIATNAGVTARVLDVEPGDAVAGQAGGWVRMDQRAGWHCPLACPTIYASISNMGNVIANLHAWGLVQERDYMLWDAAWNGYAHVDSGYDATQWASTSVDYDSGTLAFFGVHPGPPPPPPDPHHYKRFASFELPTVQQYDGARQHPQQFGRYIVRVLEPRLRQLAVQVAHNATHGTCIDVSSCASHWGEQWRWWRFQQLIARAKGLRFV